MQDMWMYGQGEYFCLLRRVQNTEAYACITTLIVIK